MAEIKVLASETIDKIAAGEVVERPSSVVKELVENAIDAGAASITVEIKDGGIEFIRVTDNGSGMEREQLRKAFLRHATSKIEKAEDLTYVSSLGFRGEALSSIAAVSKVEVITKTSENLTGTRMVLEGGIEKAFEEAGAPDGTTFLVRNLFFNVPVRRKFLKQPTTESGYIANLMEHLALSKPKISFKFIVGKQTKFHTSGNGNLNEVIYRIFGREAISELIPIQVQKNGIAIEGYLGKPTLVRNNRNFEIYYINGRFIKSNLIAKAIEEGYKEYLMQHKFPFCILHITMNTEEVDVNVHPTKMDVRFSNGAGLLNFLSGAVRETLKQREMIPSSSLDTKKKDSFQNRQEKYIMEDTKYQAGNQQTPSFDTNSTLPNNPVWQRVKETSQKIAKKTWNEEVFFSENSEDKVQKNEKNPKSLENRKEPSNQWQKFSENQGTANKKWAEILEDKTESLADRQKEKAENRKLYGKAENIAVPAMIQKLQTTEKKEQGTQINLFEDKILSLENRVHYQMIGQIFDTYWLIQFADKLLIVDQHAAHEKVKYERLMKQYKEKKIISQNLLPPVIVTLTGQEEAVLAEHKDAFRLLGFEIESFGGNEYALRSVPIDLYGCSEREMFLAVLDGIQEGNGRGEIHAIEEKIASMSCKAAVKGNNRLSRLEMEELVDELLTLENPYNCPHGRPTMITITKTEMEKKFKRI